MYKKNNNDLEKIHFFLILFKFCLKEFKYALLKKYTMTKIKIEEKILLEKNWLGLFRFIFNYFYVLVEYFFFLFIQKSLACSKSSTLYKEKRFKLFYLKKNFKSLIFLTLSTFFIFLSIDKEIALALTVKFFVFSIIC
jgi:hypothetical protein